MVAFTPESKISISNAKWLNNAMQFDGHAIEQFFFPMSLNAPALVVNTPWHWRTAASIAKKFMLEETAAKFEVLGHDFLPALRDRGVPYNQIPEWLLSLASNQIKW